MFKLNQLEQRMYDDLRKIKDKSKKATDRFNLDLAEYAKLKLQIEAKVKTVEVTIDKMVSEHISMN